MDRADARKQYGFLDTLAKSDKFQRKAILDTINSNQVTIISQACYNLFLNESLQPTETQKKKLNKKLGILRRLASKSITNTEKKNLIQSNPTLIQTIAEATADFLEKAL